MGDDIDGVVVETVVDAYGDDEHLWLFRQFFEDETTFPFPCQVVGSAVNVVDADWPICGTGWPQRASKPGTWTRPGGGRAVPKARGKILQKSVQRWSMTPAMVDLPRVRLE